MQTNTTNVSLQHVKFVIDLHSETDLTDFTKPLSLIVRPENIKALEAAFVYEYGLLFQDIASSSAIGILLTICKYHQDLMTERHVLAYTIDKSVDTQKAVIGKYFYYDDDVYEVTGFRKHKCRIHDDWYFAVEYTSTTTKENYSRCVEMFFDRFLQLKDELFKLG